MPGVNWEYLEDASDVLQPNLTFSKPFERATVNTIDEFGMEQINFNSNTNGRFLNLVFVHSIQSKIVTYNEQHSILNNTLHHSPVSMNFTTCRSTYEKQTVTFKAHLNRKLVRQKLMNIDNNIVIDTCSQKSGIVEY